MFQLANIAAGQLTRHILQAFVKRHLEDAAVSQRDLQRVFNLLAFFIQHHHSRRRDLPETVPQSPDALVHRSLLLSIAVAYFFRLDRPLRQEFLEVMAELDARNAAEEDQRVPCYDMDAVIQYELDLYISAAELPPGIAPNQALKENFFCIAVCVETKTPLIIIGTPGGHFSQIKRSIAHLCVEQFIIHMQYSIDVVGSLAVRDASQLLQMVQQQQLIMHRAHAVKRIQTSQHQTCKAICFTNGLFCCRLAAQERDKLPRDDSVPCTLQATARH